MDRRDFIKHSSAAAAVTIGTGAVAGSAVAGQDPGVAAPAVVPSGRALRLAMPWTQNGRGLADSAGRLTRWLEMATDGRYRIAIADARHDLSTLAAGDADLYHGSAHEFTRLDPAFGYFAGLPGPMGLRPTYLNAWLMAGAGQTLWDDLAATHGFKPLLAGHSGARAKLWSREAIREASELQGLRIAAYGLAADVVTELGAVAVDIPMADAGAALADGAIDAVEFGGTIAAYGCDLHQAARFCLRPGLARNGFGSVLAIRNDIWRGLSTGDQAIFAAGAAQELNSNVAEALAASGALRAGLSERLGIAFEKLPVGLSDAASRAAARVVAGLASTSPAAGRIHASYGAFRAGLPGVRRARPAVA